MTGLCRLVRCSAVIPPSPALRTLAWLAVLAVSLAAASAAATLEGRVELREQGKPSPEVAGAIVYFVCGDGAGPATPKSAEIMTRNRQFIPRTLVVPVASTVRFPNDDPIQHNVFSVSRDNRFDLGRYGKGRGRAQTFGSPGVVRVFCNVHRNMAATVLVLDTPFYAQVGADGRFELASVPVGRGTLHVWHPRAEPWSAAIEVPASDSVEVRLEATLPPVPSHLDKFGRPYRDEADGSYR
jgi:plastocyanin